MEKKTQPVGPSGEGMGWEAIARFLAHESSEAEAEAVSRFLAADPARAELVRALDRAADRVAYRAPAGLELERALERVKRRRSSPEMRVLSGGKPGRLATWLAPTRWPVPLQAAAAVALAVGGTYLWRHQERPGGPRPVAGAAAASFATGVGQRDSLELADGTRVVLGPDSRLTVAAGYGTSQREVELRGQAFFEVRGEVEQKFTVRAGGAAIQDLGTAFAVADEPGGGVGVVVTQGSVALSAAAAPGAGTAVLREGDRGWLDAEGRAVVERGAATSDDLAWTRGRLVFQEAPLTRVAADLQRWYGVRLRFADPDMTHRHLTASFEDEGIDQVLRVVALALGAEVERRGDTAFVRPAAQTPTR